MLKLEENKQISGFSKLSKTGKLKWIVENFFKDPELVARELKSYWLHEEKQKVFFCMYYDLYKFLKKWKLKIKLNFYFQKVKILIDINMQLKRKLI